MIMWVTSVSGLRLQPQMPIAQSQINAAKNQIAGITYDPAGNQPSLGATRSPMTPRTGR
jgi:hypothetical protein